MMVYRTAFFAYVILFLFLIYNKYFVLHEDVGYILSHDWFDFALLTVSFGAIALWKLFWPKKK